MPPWGSPRRSRSKFPELVHSLADDTLSVAYGNLTAGLLAATKEQQKLIEEQSARIDERDAEIEALPADLSALGAQVKEIGTLLKQKAATPATSK